MNGVATWPGTEGPADGMSVADAYAHCARLARAHYENFTVGSWLLPRRLRDDLAAVYAFARGADDLADEGPDDGRLARLDEWGTRLDACACDPRTASDPVFVALGHTIARHALPVEPFHDLLHAFRRDAGGDTRTIATYADLQEYCRCSANPVGRIVLALFGHREAEQQARADDICTALQETNFWQDVAGDLTRGRVYLPVEDLERFPGASEALARREATPAFRALLAFEVDRTRGLFQRGLALADLVSGRLRAEVRIFARCGLTILDRIAGVDYDVFTRRPKLTRGDLLAIVLGGFRR